MKLSANARSALRSALTNHDGWTKAFRQANGYDLATMTRDAFVEAASKLGINVTEIAAAADVAPPARAQAVKVLDDDAHAVTVPARVNAVGPFVDTTGDKAIQFTPVPNRVDVDALQAQVSKAQVAAAVFSDAADTDVPDMTNAINTDGTLSIPDAPVPVSVADQNRFDQILALVAPDVKFSAVYTTALQAVLAARELATRLQAALDAPPVHIDALDAAMTRPSLDFVPPSWSRTFGDYVAIGAVIALVGPSGNGKTTCAKELLKRAGFNVYEFDCNDATMPQEIIGKTGLVQENGATVTVWQPGPLARAFADPQGALVLNEYDALDPRTGMALQSALEAGAVRRVTMPDTGEQLESVGRCPIVLTMNTTGHGASVQYAGRNALDGANRDRVELIVTGYEHEAEILQAHGFAAETAEKLSDYAIRARHQLARMNSREIFSNRRLLTAAALIERRNYTLPRAMELAFVNRLPEREREAFASVV